MTPQPPVVRLSGAGRRFGSLVALSDVDLTLTDGERVAVLGASGAGKSTLLALMTGSLRATEGQVEVFGRDVAQLSVPELRATQRRIGSVSQRLDLVDQVRVLHNVNAGRLGQWGTWQALVALARARPDTVVIDALQEVGLEWAVHERTERLSGGERQRVAIARLLVQRAELVLADEPVSSLDPTRAAEIMELLQAPAAQATFVVSLHQPALARRHCTRAVGLRDGRIAFDVPAADLTDDVLTDLYALT